MEINSTRKSSGATANWDLESIEKVAQQMVIDAVENHLSIILLPRDLSGMTSTWLDRMVTLFTSRTKDELSDKSIQLLMTDDFLQPLKNIVGKYFYYNERKQLREVKFIANHIVDKIEEFSFLPDDL